MANNATANTAIVYNANGLGTGFPALTFTSSQWLDGSISITGSTMTVFSIFSMNSMILTTLDMLESCVNPQQIWAHIATEPIPKQSHPILHA